MASDKRVKVTLACAECKQRNYNTMKKKLGLKIGKAFKNTFYELKKVTWPTKKELVTYSLVTLGFMVVMGIIIYLIDLGSGELVNLLLKI